MQIQGTTPIRIMKKDKISGMYKTQALSKQLKDFRLSFAEEEKLPAANQTQTLQKMLISPRSRGLVEHMEERTRNKDGDINNKIHMF